MILYVDYEHPSTYTGPLADQLLAARTRITYRLHDLTGQPCLLLRYPFVEQSVIDTYGITAIFISGAGAEPDTSDPGEVQGLQAVIAAATVPVFGFCGGMQLIGQTFGTELVRLAPEQPAELLPSDREPASTEPSSWPSEIGYHPVRLVGHHPMTAALGPAPVFRHFHSWQLSEVPTGFVRLAETDRCSVQLIAHQSAPIAGSQFHPEYWTDEAPDGHTLLAGFCRWAQLID